MKKINEKNLWRLYEQALAYNTSIKLNETVRVNENFYIGRQWEGVESRGLPTPQFNFLKRVVGFLVATITSDNLRVNAQPLSNGPMSRGLELPARIVNQEFEALMELNRIPGLLREFARNAAVDGDACIYSYWDSSQPAPGGASGAVRSEIIENTRVFFGNPADRNVQTQPYIIISSRRAVEELRQRAADNGFQDSDRIGPDEDDRSPDPYKRSAGKATCLLILWRDRDSGKIFAFEACRGCPVSPVRDTGLRRYPVCWLSWDYIQDSYHGQAMITGLIPNQIFVNKIWALSMLSFMKTAYPKYIYDKTRIRSWDNRVGAAIGINGGDVNSVAKIMDPAVISPQISQFITLAVEQTEESLGATAVALGDTEPNNTSAIIALQRAAATPIELTKQNLYLCVEDLFRIYLDFMCSFYGVRQVDGENGELLEFDYACLENHPMNLKLEVGESSYYSELASLQTLDRLLEGGHITALQYLERVPDGYIPGRRSLVEELKRQSLGVQAADVENDEITM